MENQGFRLVEEKKQKKSFFDGGGSPAMKKNPPPAGWCIILQLGWKRFRPKHVIHKTKKQTAALQMHGEG